MTSDATWVTPEAGGTGAGSGLLTYRVASNAAVARQARLTLFAGQPAGVLTLTQDGPVAAAGCAYELRPTLRSFAPAPSAAEVQVFAPYGCRWAFEGNGSWITVGPEDSGPSPWGNGNGTVVVVVALGFVAAGRAEAQLKPPKSAADILAALSSGRCGRPSIPSAGTYSSITRFQVLSGLNRSIALAMLRVSGPRSFS